MPSVMPRTKLSKLTAFEVLGESHICPAKARFGKVILEEILAESINILNHPDSSFALTYQIQTSGKS